MTDSKKTPSLSRRHLFAGAGTAGALAAVAAVLPAAPKAPETAQAAPASAQDESGYRLTDHVRRYYQTTRV